MKMNYKKEARKTYNLIAKSYHWHRTKKYPRGWFYNELLEMPTTLELLGNVKGKRILDLGCGTGIYVKILRKKGAIIKGIDISKKMIEIARRENPGVKFAVGSGDKLPYKNKEFDIVLSTLAIEYIPDWNKLFKEVNRVLKRNGLFVFSTGNPVINTIKKEIYKGRKFRIIKNYFKEGLRKTEWHDMIKKGDVIHMKWYHKTYGTIVKTIVRAGFELIDYEDAYPLKKAKRLFPKDYKLWTNMPFFCTWKTKKKGLK